MSKAEGRERVCVCVCSLICVGEGLGEQLRAEEKPLGYPLLTQGFWGGVCAPILPQLQGRAPISLSNFLHRSLGFQSLPDVSLLLDFPSFSMLLFPSQLFPQGYHPRFSLPSPTQLQELLFGGWSWYVSSQLRAWLSWESWE